MAEVGAERALVIRMRRRLSRSRSVAILGEQLGAGAIAGLLLILAGSWLATDGRLPPGLAAVVTRLRARRRQTGPADARP